jgi:hypothetical protein
MSLTLEEQKQRRREAASRYYFKDLEHSRAMRKTYRDAHRQQVREGNNRWLDTRPLYRAWLQRRAFAKLRGLPFEIVCSDLVMPEYCTVLGIKLEFNKGRARDNSPSIDRIKPELGYVRGNVRVISNRANLLKTNATAEELRLVAEDAARLAES